MFRRTASRGFDLRVTHRGFARIGTANVNHPRTKKSHRMVDACRRHGKAIG